MALRRPDNPEAQELATHPPVWKYAPKGTTKKRELAEFDALVDNSYKALTSGSGLDRAVAAESFRLRTTRAEDRAAEQQGHTAIRDAVVQTLESGKPVRRSQAAAAAWLRENAPDVDLDDNGITGLVKRGLSALDAPRRATVGALTGDTPAESVRRAKRGWEGEQFSGQDVGFVRHLPAGSRPRRVAGEVAEEVVDPLNVAVAGVGPKVASRLARGGRASKVAAEFVRPIATGPMPKRLAAEAAVSYAGRKSGEAAQKWLAEHGYGEGAQLAGGLAAGIAAGGLTAGALNPTAFRDATQNLPMGASIRLEADPSGSPPRMYSDPRDPNVTRPRTSLKQAEQHIESVTKTRDNGFVDVEIDGNPVWSNGHIAVIGERRPFGGDNTRTVKPEGLKALINSVTETSPRYEPVVRSERYADANTKRIDLDTTFLRGVDDPEVYAVVDTQYLDYFRHRFGDDIELRGTGPKMPFAVIKDGRKVGLISPMALPDATLATIRDVAAQFDEAGISPAPGKAPAKPKPNPETAAYEAQVRRNTAGGPQATKEAEARLAALRKSELEAPARRVGKDNEAPLPARTVTRDGRVVPFEESQTALDLAGQRARKGQPRPEPTLTTEGEQMAQGWFERLTPAQRGNLTIEDARDGFRFGVLSGSDTVVGTSPLSFLSKHKGKTATGLREAVALRRADYSGPAAAAAPPPEPVRDVPESAAAPAPARQVFAGDAERPALRAIDAAIARYVPRDHSEAELLAKFAGMSDDDLRALDEQMRTGEEIALQERERQGGGIAGAARMNGGPLAARRHTINPGAVSASQRLLDMRDVRKAIAKYIGEGEESLRAAVANKERLAAASLAERGARQEARVKAAIWGPNDVKVGDRVWWVERDEWATVTKVNKASMRARLEGGHELEARRYDDHAFAKYNPDEPPTAATTNAGSDISAPARAIGFDAASEADLARVETEMRVPPPPTEVLEIRGGAGDFYSMPRSAATERLAGLEQHLASPDAYGYGPNEVAELHAEVQGLREALGAIDPRPEVRAAEDIAVEPEIVAEAVDAVRAELPPGRPEPEPLPPPTVEVRDLVPLEEPEPAGGWDDGGAGGPPTEIVPTWDGGEPPRGPNLRVPKRGKAGIVESLRNKAETLAAPGKVGEWMLQQPVIRQGAIFLNPSLDLERRLHVSYNASRATESELATMFKSRYAERLGPLLNAFEETPPRYIGPDDNPFQGTLKDLGDHPDHYADVTPELRKALDDYRRAGLSFLRYARRYFNVDILPFTSGHPDFVYFRTIDTAEDMLTALDRTAAQLASSGVRKERLFDGAYDRWKAAKRAGKEFNAETDIQMMAEQHAQGLARLAARETFIEGSGGLTRVQAVDLMHPGLRAAKDRAAARVSNLNARLKTAMRQGRAAADQTVRESGAMTAAEKRAMPIIEAVDELGAEYGPELSYLSGQLREIGLQWRRTRARLIAAGEKVETIEARHADLLAEYEAAADTLDQLRKGYANANLNPYVLNDKVFRYFEAPVSAKVDGLLGRELANMDAVKVIDEARSWALNIDTSIATIQGSLVAAMDPGLTYKTAKDVIAAVRDPEFMTRIALDESDAVRAFTRDTGMEWPLHGLARGDEYTAKGAERIPGLGPRLRQVNDSLWRGVMLRLFEQYKADRAWLQHTNPGMSVDVAGMEASSALRKLMPLMNPAETGRGGNRTIVERAVTVSPSFLWQPLALVSDATSGLAKLGLAKATSTEGAWQTLRGREQVAIVRLMWMAGTFSTIAAMSAAASADANNLTVEEAVEEVLDPRSGRFLSLVLGDKATIGMGGPMRSLIRAMAPRKGKDGEYHWGAGLMPFLMSKNHPVSAAVIDQIKGKDYFGADINAGIFGEAKDDATLFSTNTLNRLYYGAESLLPLIGGEVFAGVRTGSSPTEIAAGVAGQGLGTNLYQRRPQEELDSISRGKYGVPFFDASRLDQAKMKAQHPGLWRRVIDSAGADRQEAEVARQTLYTQQMADDAGFIGGKMNREDWTEAQKDRTAELAARLNQIYNPKQLREVPYEKPSNAFERYINEIQASVGANGKPDWEAVDRWKAQQPAADLDYIDQQTGVGGTAMSRVYRAVRREHDRIYSIPKYRGYTADQAQEIDDLWEKVRGVAGSADRQPMQRAYAQVVGERNDAISRGVRARISGALTTLKAREQYLAKHPDVRLFYGVGPLSPKDQTRLRMLVAREQARIEGAKK